MNDCQENVYDHWEDYTDLWNGEDPEKVFTKIFGKNNKWGYTATCDIPGNTYWETLTEIFPEAKGRVQFFTSHDYESSKM